MQCWYCGCDIPYELIEKIKENQKNVCCERCCAILSEYDNSNDGQNFERGIDLKEIHRQWIFILFRQAYGLLKKSRYTNMIREKRELKISQINRLVKKLRMVSLEQDIPPKWLDNPHINRRDFLDYHEYRQGQIRINESFEASFLPLFQHAIKFVYGVIVRNHKIVDFHGKIQMEIIKDLMEHYGVSINYYERGTFLYYITMFISRYIYDLIKSSKENPQQNVDLIEQITKATIFKIFSSKEVNNELLKLIISKNRRRFKQKYDIFRQDLVWDQIYCESFLNFIKWLTTTILDLMKDHFEFSNLQGIKRDLVENLTQTNFFRRNSRFPSEFKANLIITLSRMIYSIIKTQANKMNLELHQIDLKNNAINEIVEIISSGILNNKQINVEYIVKTNNIQETTFCNLYQILRSELKTDNIYNLSFKNNLYRLTSELFNLTSRRHDWQNISHFEHALINNLKNFENKVANSLKIYQKCKHADTSDDKIVKNKYTQDKYTKNFPTQLNSKKVHKKMKHTIIFRLHPTVSQERKLHEIFTIYNRVRRIGYKLLFAEKDLFFSKNKRDKDGLNRRIHAKLMEICKNNPYVNTITRDNKIRLKQQDTWLKKTKHRMKRQIETIEKKIEGIKQENKKDRRLKGLYARLSSIQNKYGNLKLRPIVFGTKRGFRKRIRGNMSREEFKIKRDSSFSCEGKKQYGAVNHGIKVFPNQTIRIKTFHREKEKKYLFVPFTVNNSQVKWFKEILNTQKYLGIIKRKMIKGEVRYFAHISYDIPESDLEYNFENGAVGLDMNYNFVSLSNVDKHGNFKSYHEISFKNLHSYRKNKREDYISYKMDKVINYCINKKKGLVIENLSFDQEISYRKKRNRMLSNFKKSALDLLERKCLKRGVAIKKVHPAYTSLIGKYKYSRLYNLSTHVLASYVIARKGLGFKEELPTIYKWLLAQVGDAIKPRLKPSSPYYKWAKLHDFFKHSGITSFKTSVVMKKTLQMKYVLNPATGAQPDNLKAGLSSTGKIDDLHKFWNFIEITNFL